MGLSICIKQWFLSIESDRTVIVHDCNTLEHIYKPLKIKSRIISFTPVKCADPNKHAVLFLCRDDNLKLYLNGEIVASKFLPSSTIHSLQWDCHTYVPAMLACMENFSQR